MGQSSVYDATLPSDVHTLDMTRPAAQEHVVDCEHVHAAPPAAQLG